MNQIESFTVYLPKAIVSIFLLLAPWMENVDWGIKITATIIGLVIGILTGVRIYHDIRIRIGQRKERDLRNHMLEEDIKRMWEKKNTP
jgi:hypothetical protein